MASFALSYDYRCPFAKNLHLHLVAALRAGATHDVTFAPWSLSEGHREPGSPSVWDDPTKDDELLALLVSISLRDQQPDTFLQSHEALFLGRHVTGLRLASWEDLTTALAGIPCDLDAVRADISSRRPHEVLRQSHADYAEVESFGVPTFLLNGQGTFVRYMTPSVDDRASRELIDSLVHLLEHQTDLNEFKHTQVPF